VTTAARRLVGVDVGGTFTDVIAIEGGRLFVSKVPTDLHASERSVLQGAEEIGVGDAQVFNLASTAGLNAILTRRIAKVAFLTTYGHRDVLDRAHLWRPFEALTDPSWRRGVGDQGRPLVPRYLRRGIIERLDRRGGVLIALDDAQARAEIELVAECGVEGIAICLINSYTNPVHELRLRELVRDVMGDDVACSISSEVCPLAKEYPRASTTVVDLLMKLKYSEYTDRLEDGLAQLGFDGELNYADCSAMLLPASYAMERPYRLVVGGPAAGTVAGAHFGRHIGKADLLCADVGGTSCDISVVRDGAPWLNASFDIEWDLIVNALATEIVTIGAGGGSIVSVGRSGELLVGPDSAGADPGPACYAMGATAPTITDAALVMGILAPDRFLGGRIPLDRGRAVAAFEALDTTLAVGERVRQAWMIGLHHIADGVADLAIRRGLDARDHSLVAFGAAGPMLLPSLLDILPLESVIVPPNPGGFSAAGLLSADRVFSESRTLYGILTPELLPRIAATVEELEGGLLERADVDPADATISRSFDGRLFGQSWDTPFIPIPDGSLDEGTIPAMVEAFHREYERRNGNRFEWLRVEGVTYRVQVVVPSDKVEYRPLPVRADELRPSGRVVLQHLGGGRLDAPTYEREALAPGDVIAGPAIIAEEMSTTFVPPGRIATVGTYGELHIV